LRRSGRWFGGLRCAGYDRKGPTRVRRFLPPVIAGYFDRARGRFRGQLTSPDLPTC
jgi:hypothetical protein